MKRTYKILSAASVALLLAGSASGQSKIKDGTVTGTSSLPSSSSVLDLESNKRGLLFPRVPLTGSTAASPLAAHVAGMVVYNTATTADVIPGFYYNDGVQWVRIANLPAGSTSASGDISNGNGILVTNGTGAALKATSLRLDSTAVAKMLNQSPVKDSVTMTVATLLTSSTTLRDSLTKTISTIISTSTLLRDSISSVVTSTIAAGDITGKDLTNGNGILVTGGTGTTLKATSLRLDSTAVAKMITASPVKDSVLTLFGGTGWKTGGNTATATDFLGTNNDVNLIFKRNGLLSGTIGDADGTGNLSLGGGTPDFSNPIAQYNSYMGSYTGGSLTSGVNNTGMGSFSLFAATTGSNNTAIGFEAVNTANGDRNTGVGSFAMGSGHLSSSDNVAVGYQALGAALLVGLSGNDNVAIGSGAGANLSGASNNNMIIGKGQELGTGSPFYTTSNKMNIGGGIFGTGMTGTYAAPAGNIGINNTAPSAKLDVSNNGSSTVAALKVRTPFSGAATDSLLTWNPADSSVRKISSSALGNAWGLKGNAGTDTSNFIGTTDSHPLYFKTGGVITGFLPFLSIDNIAFGYNAMSNASSPFFTTNIAIGNNALSAPTRASINNIAVGQSALQNNTIGGINTAVGESALRNTSTGSFNTGIGRGSMMTNTSGSRNVAYGANSLQNNLSGGSNIAIGTSANYTTTIGSYNIAIGDSQTVVSATASNQLNIGGAIFGTGLTGKVAAPAGNIGISNTVPTAKLDVSNNGSTTVAALKVRTPFSGAATDSLLTWNPADSSVRKISSSALSSGWSLSGNTATAANYIGTNNNVPLLFKQNSKIAGGITDGDGTANTSFGSLSPDFSNPSVTGTSNSFFGGYAGNALTSGINNTGIGQGALISITSGGSNIAVGETALGSIETGTGNTALGTEAMITAIGSASNNTVVGFLALPGGFGMSGNNNLVLGALAGSEVTGLSNNNIIVGAGQEVGTGTAYTTSNKMNIAGAIFGTGISGTYAAPAGNIGISNTAPTAKLDVSNNGSTTVAALKLRTPFSGTATDSLLTWNPADSSVRKVAATVISGSASAIRTVTSAATVTATDNTILCNATSAGFTLTLPAASAATGKVYVIRKVDETTNVLTFSTALRMSVTTNITSLNFLKTYRIQSDGTSWWVID